MTFFKVVIALQTSSNKLGVINEPILIRIHHPHCIHHILFSNIPSFYLLNPFLQLFQSQLAIAIFIELAKCFSQCFNLILWNSRGNQSQCSSLKIYCVYIILHIFYHLHTNFNLIIFYFPLILYPWMIKRL